LDQLYKARVLVVALLFGIASIALMTAAGVLETLTWKEIVTTVLVEIAAVLFAAGLLTPWFEKKTRDAADRRSAEQIRDSVLGSYAADPAMLESIAGSPMGDRIAVNALAAATRAPLGAVEANVAQLRTQFTGVETWRDVAVSMDIDPWAGGPVAGPDAMFAVTVRCEYRLTPTVPMMRFTCTSDLALYAASRTDNTAISVWYIDPVRSVDPASIETFEVQGVNVNGAEVDIERASSPHSQTYTVVLPDAALTAGEQITISYALRVLVQQRTPLLGLDVPRPTERFRATVTFGRAGIDQLSVIEYLGNTVPARIEYTQPAVPVRAVTVSHEGWAYPRAGLAIGWSLAEQPVLTVPG
jgi:hypothetical protein